MGWVIIIMVVILITIVTAILTMANPKTLVVMTIIITTHIYSIK